jgi:hypothetical protein
MGSTFANSTKQIGRTAKKLTNLLVIFILNLAHCKSIEVHDTNVCPSSLMNQTNQCIMPAMCSVGSKV